MTNFVSRRSKKTLPYGFFPLLLMFGVLSAVLRPCALAGQDPATLLSSSPEDLHSITLAKGSLVEDEPIPGEKDDDPKLGFIRERYQVAWREGDPMDLYIIRPRGVEKPPVILFLYGYPQDTDRFKNDGWCTRVTSGGFAAVGFVSALTGHRFHDRPMKQSFVTEMSEALVKSTHDVQMVLNHLSKYEKFDMAQVAMFGQGSGGTIAILASAADPRIHALQVVNPWADWPDWAAKSTVIPENDRANILKPEFLTAVAPFDPVRWFPKAKAQLILVQNVRDDSSVPPKSQARLEKSVPQRALVDQLGDGRAFAEEYGGGKLFAWVKEQLQPGAMAEMVKSRKQKVQYYPPKADTIRP
jgi:dienelactone hydrolase